MTGTKAASATASASSSASLAAEMAAVGQRFDARGWVMGTSGNMSVVLGRTPLALLTTASSVHKGSLTAGQFVVVSDDGFNAATPGMRPSAESELHMVIARETGAGAVLHTHSVWATVLSRREASTGALTLQGYEMLKGLSGVTTHEHTEVIPILANDQDMARLGRRLTTLLRKNPECHAVLLAAHGLYTWGSTLAECERHVEILEFLLEVTGRSLELRP